MFSPEKQRRLQTLQKKRRVPSNNKISTPQMEKKDTLYINTPR